MITLTTDFGDSPYVGAMRGAIASLAPETRLLDITHRVPAHDIVTGAFALFSAVPFYPEGTIHVGVVDPGVGTERMGVAIRAGGQILVGPDNGLLLPAARRLGIEAVVGLTEGKYWREEVSRTFHGRDVFGPVAAHLANGLDLKDLGATIPESDLVDLSFGEPFVKDGVWKCEVINVDRFGNVTTNLPGGQVIDEAEWGALALVEAHGRRVEVELTQTYGQANPGTPILTIGSAGFAELAMSEDDLADWFSLEIGDEVFIRFVPRAAPREGED